MKNIQIETTHVINGKQAYNAFTVELAQLKDFDSMLLLADILRNELIARGGCETESVSEFIFWANEFAKDHNKPTVAFFVNERVRLQASYPATEEEMQAEMAEEKQQANTTMMIKVTELDSGDILYTVELDELEDGECVKMAAAIIHNESVANGGRIPAKKRAKEMHAAIKKSQKS